MSRWLVVVYLVMASAIARAQPADQPAPASVPAQVTATTEQARSRVAELDHALAQQLTAQQRQQAQFAAQTATVDRLKQRKRSWANDRELTASEADANDTAQRLEAIARDLHAAQDQLVAARKVLVIAIDAELAAGPAPARAQQLATWRTAVAPVAAPPRKIVVPNSNIDPSADAEELEAQAAALKQTEGELAKQEETLATQAQALDAQARMRKEHDRAKDLSERDDDESHRTTTTGSTHSEAGNNSLAPNNGANIGGAATPGPTTPPVTTNAPSGTDRGGYESDATVTLADVVDASTIERIKRAQTSNDPRARADAAKAAHDEVARARDQLRKKREAIEARARQLRGGK